MRRSLIAFLLPALAAGCESEHRFARSFQIASMAETIGGPAAVGRPGDYLLENDRIRAVVHGRHNYRSVAPISNGSLVDLDIQRPHHRYGVGRGKDAFYELGPMINLKVSAATTMENGPCSEVGSAPCPEQNAACARVTATGAGDNIMGIIGLLDLAIRREVGGQKIYDPDKLRITNDYDLCPGEPFIRVTTTAHLDATKDPVTVDMPEFKTRVGLLDVMLGEHTGQDCAKEPCPAGESCDDLLIPLALGGFSTEMKRCRKPDQKLAGIMGGDLMLFAGKVNVFALGAGFDHESYIRSLFNTGGDVFSNPLSLATVAAVGDGVSYAYFNKGGQVMIPVFSESFTVSMTNRASCPRQDPGCLKGRQVRFHRFVSVGQGDVASALEGFYKVQSIRHGRVEGHVVDPHHREPLAGVDVYAFKVPQAWDRLTDKQIGAKTAEELVAQHRQETATEANPDGETGIISHFRTDIGLDRVEDGSFAGPLPVAGPGGVSCPSPECRYLLVARVRERGASGVYPVTVREDRVTQVTMVAGHSATLQFDVQDATGRPLPSKLTIGHCFPECARDEDCGPEQTCDNSRLCRPKAGWTSGSCRPDQRWAGGTCVCREDGRLPIWFGGHRYADRTVHVYHSASGKGELSMAPGSYQVVVSRGPEYEISRHFVTLRDGMVQRLKAVLPRSVNTEGWITADFHVHGPGSPDSGLDHRTRIRSFVAEGVELVTATDHDWLTDYGPTIYQLGVRGWIKSQVGLEVSPLDYGHFIGFPLRFDENVDQNGAFHWRVADPQNDPASPNYDPTLPDWKNLNPLTIFKKLRDIGSLGVEQTVVFVAHFYDHFTFYGVDPFSLELPSFSITALFNKVLLPINFSPAFDALEGLNGKNYDIIRRPTYKEIQDYNVNLARAVAAGAKLSYADRQRSYLDISAAAQREFIRRTPEEQKNALSYSNPAFQCRCTQDLECGPGFLCDEDTGGCVAGCTSDSQCDAALVSAGREACRQKGGSDPGRKLCQRLPQACVADADCAVDWKGAREGCVAGQCELACTKDADCTDALRPRCDTTSSHCAPVAAALASDPCPTMRGTVDDWFQMLNHGIRRPFLGNSDSHGVYGVEAGVPRNYIRSSTDLPQRIDLAEVAAQVKAGRSFPSYGPFVELKANGQPMGETVQVQKGDPVQVKIKVQSALWFDVDRIEVYRNGELIETITGSTDCRDKSKCILVPNQEVVNFDGVIVDKPQEDAWYVVLVMGLDGKSMTPVYSSTPEARLGMFELIQRLTPLLPPLRSLRTPLSPTMSKALPFALTNPVWVDVGGDGIEPLRTPPAFWVQSDDSSSSALTQRQPAHGHDHGHDHGHQRSGHDHSNGIGRMRVDTASIMGLVRDGTITPQVLRHAMDQFRYLGH